MPTNPIALPSPEPPPHCKGYPLVGILPNMLLDGPSELVRLARQHPGKVCTSTLGPLRFYLVTHPEHVQEVLVDKWQNFGKGGMYRTMRRLLGNSLFTSEGDEWVRHRRLMQPLFTSKYLASLAATIAQVVTNTIPRYGAAADAGAELDMVKEMAHLGEAIIIETMFSGSITPSESATLAESFVVAVDTLLSRMFVSFLPSWFPLPGERALRQALTTIDEVMLRLIRAPRSGGAPRNDLLSLLLSAKDNQLAEVDARQVRDHLVTLFIAGSETSADTMTWLLYILATYTEVQEKLRTEVESALGGRTPEFSDLANLPYTRMVIMETIRLYPAGWFFPRFSKEDDTIGGTAIPGGSTILLSPYVTHRDPAFWPQPDSFLPERFAAERSAARPRFAYLPFGGGPHQCIGMQFALILTQMVTAMLVQRFRPSLVPGQRVVPKGRGSLKPRHGLKLVFTRV